MDVLAIWVTGVFPQLPIRNRYLVEPGGEVALGPIYGRVNVAGLTLDAAEAAIQKHLREEFQTPEVQVLTTSRATQWSPRAPRSPYRISAGDLLLIRVSGTIAGQPIDGQFTVGPGGKVNLGKIYSTVVVKGLTPTKAEAAITKQLSSDGLVIPSVSVTLAGWKSDRRLVQQAASDQR